MTWLTLFGWNVNINDKSCQIGCVWFCIALLTICRESVSMRPTAHLTTVSTGVPTEYGTSTAFVSPYDRFFWLKNYLVLSIGNVLVRMLSHLFINVMLSNVKLLLFTIDIICFLTHWGRHKMDAISQTTFSTAFSWKKMFEFQLIFHWSLFLRVQLTIFQHCFR